MANTAFDLHFIKQNTTVIDGIVESSVDPAVTEFIFGTDGNTYNAFAAVNEAKPVARFTGIKIAEILTLVGSDFYADADTYALDMWLKEADAFATHAATGPKISITKGLIVPRTLSAEQGREARIECEVVMGGNEGNAPWTYTADQSYPTGDDMDELFTIGGVTVNDVAVNDVQQSQVDFGLAAQVVMADGLVYPTLVYVQGYDPTITFRTLNLDLMSTLGIAGANNSCAVTYLKCAEGGVRAGSGDQTVTANQARVTARQISASHRQNAMLEVTVTPTYNGTNAPLVVS